MVTAGEATVGRARFQRERWRVGLIERTGQPIAAPSANRANRLSPTRAEHVLADLDGRIDLILDSGPTTVGLESTVLDLTGEPRDLLRPGPISIKELEAVLSGQPVVEVVGRTIVWTTVRAPARCRSTTHPGRRPSASNRSTN